jgi:hypothetical protein
LEPSSCLASDLPSGLAYSLTSGLASSNKIMHVGIRVNDHCSQMAEFSAK